MNNVILDDVSIPDDICFFILEDTPIYQKKLLSNLSDLGFRGKVVSTATLTEALEQFEEAKPHFILSDWNLPDGFGIDFLKAVRAKTNFADTPFLMVTTVDDIDNILEAVSCGVDGYIVKPWTEQDLIEKISFAFSKRQKA